MSDQLPVIDLSGGDLPRLAALIGAACREIGFFYVVGHTASRRL